MFVTKLLYRVYERRLESQLRRGPIPRHLGLIVDGNRRFARRAGLGHVSEGHRRGADKVDEVLGWCNELAIPVVTMWALSTDNLKRDPDELIPLLAIIEEKIADLAEQQRTARPPRRIRVVGRTELLPPSTQEVIARAEALTERYPDYQLNIAVGYGGREEITDAVKRMIADRIARGDSLEGVAAGLEPDEIARYLYTEHTPDPDLIIRTSGEVRLSGFLLWQSAYSEYYFCDAYWPEFRRVDFLRAIRSYQQRQRRHGR
ncbi:MAG: di-trans,poly-cis-decaprenylcistransferase [Chloroflexota bacterium]